MSVSSRRSRSTASRLAWFLYLSVAACSAKHLVDHEAALGNGVGAQSVSGAGGGDGAQPSTGGGASALGGSAANGGMAPGGAGLGGAGLGGADDTPSSAGAAPAPGGAAGATSPGAGGAFPNDECVNDGDCLVADFCTLARCQARQCVAFNAAKGTQVVQDSPPDCHAATCDGHGHVVPIVDLKNHPLSADPCLADSCSAEGEVVEKPTAAGTPCSSGQAGQLCDGTGQCVQCLSSADCAGDACVESQCVGSTCNNGVQDGSETDVDCGGICPTCKETQKCKIDQDCASDDCEQLRLTCLPTSCLDGQEDGSETDVDCGGTECSPCYYLAKCLVDADCATQKCDAEKHVCHGEPCRDNRIDGAETDVDCGGFYCGPCHTGQKCQSNFDCTSYCSTGPPHVCL